MVKGLFEAVMFDVRRAIADRRLSAAESAARALRALDALSDADIPPRQLEPVYELRNLLLRTEGVDEALRGKGAN